MLTRRTRISIETFDRGVARRAGGRRADGRVLGWDARRPAREVEHYRARVQAERESQEQPDDRTADAARLGAPDVRLGDQRLGLTRPLVATARRDRSSRPFTATARPPVAAHRGSP